MHHYTLVSHHLCPYVQRAAIVLSEKGVVFERRYVDLAAKPGWFRAISPLGKTPVLLVEDEPLFESAVICEYLDETIAPHLHPLDALERARERGWMEFGSAILNNIAAFYNALYRSGSASQYTRCDGLAVTPRRAVRQIHAGRASAARRWAMVRRRSLWSGRCRVRPGIPLLRRF